MSTGTRMTHARTSFDLFTGNGLSFEPGHENSKRRSWKRPWRRRSSSISLSGGATVLTRAPPEAGVLKVSLRCRSACGRRIYEGRCGFALLMAARVALSPAIEFIRGAGSPEALASLRVLMHEPLDDQDLVALTEQQNPDGGF